MAGIFVAIDLKNVYLFLTMSWRVVVWMATFLLFLQLCTSHNACLGPLRFLIVFNVISWHVYDRTQHDCFAFFKSIWNECFIFNVPENASINGKFFWINKNCRKLRFILRVKMFSYVNWIWRCPQSANCSSKLFTHVGLFAQRGN